MTWIKIQGRAARALPTEDIRANKGAHGTPYHEYPLITGIEGKTFLGNFEKRVTTFVH